MWFLRSGVLPSGSVYLKKNWYSCSSKLHSLLFLHILLSCNTLTSEWSCVSEPKRLSCEFSTQFNKTASAKVWETRSWKSASISPTHDLLHRPSLRKHFSELQKKWYTYSHALYVCVCAKYYKVRNYMMRKKNSSRETRGVNNVLSCFIQRVAFSESSIIPFQAVSNVEV